MAYSEALCERLRDAVDLIPHVTEKKMFGGVGFLLHGNMMVGIWKEFLILRLGVEEATKALKKKQVKLFDITGKPMKGWVMIHEVDVTNKELSAWLAKARAFVSELPAK
jgi:TfoX/Sxy family transcriptional regulator of competence genes